MSSNNPFNYNDPNPASDFGELEQELSQEDKVVGSTPRTPGKNLDIYDGIQPNGDYQEGKPLNNIYESLSNPGTKALIDQLANDPQSLQGVSLQAFNPGNLQYSDLNEHKGIVLSSRDNDKL